MKITKTINDINKTENARIKANEGCYVCPECGNTKISKFGILEDDDSIIKMSFYVTKESLFKYKSGSIDQYICQRCGTEWESEIY